MGRTADHDEISLGGVVKVDEPKLGVGKSYISKRTGQTLTILRIEGERIYYAVEGFDTLAPLFLTKAKFTQLIGTDTR